MGDQLWGYLIVRVHRGINLAVRDWHSSDPYVTITMRNQILKTRVVKSELNPTWNEELTLSIVEPLSDVEPLSVRLEVYDWDRFTPDDEMGFAEFDVTPFLRVARNAYNGSQENPVITSVKSTRTNCLAQESYIRWRNGEVVQNMILRLKNVEQGEIEISLKWREPWGMLKVHVHRGVELAIRGWRRTSDPYVIITMGNQTLKTRVVKDNLNPVWDEVLTLPVVEPLPVRLEVYDWNRISKDKFMGDAEFDLTPFLDVVKSVLNHPPNNRVVATVDPTRTNCLAGESHITWTDEGVVQNMVLRLRNVECGELEIKLIWIDVSRSRGG